MVRRMKRRSQSLWPRWLRHLACLLLGAAEVPPTSIRLRATGGVRSLRYLRASDGMKAWCPIEVAWQLQLGITHAAEQPHVRLANGATFPGGRYALISRHFCSC